MTNLNIWILYEFLIASIVGGYFIREYLPEHICGQVNQTRVNLKYKNKKQKFWLEVTVHHSQKLEGDCVVVYWRDLHFVYLIH